MFGLHLRIEHILTPRAFNRILDPLKAEWIDPTDWVRRVLIDVDAARQPDRVLANEPPAARIIVPMPVISKPGLFIELLPLKP